MRRPAKQSELCNHRRWRCQRRQRRQSGGARRYGRGTSTCERRRQLLAFEKFQQRASPRNDGVWQPRKPSHFNAIGPIRAAREQPMQKQNLIPHFLNGHVIVAN